MNNDVSSNLPQQRVYNLKLNPSTALSYYYSISNEMETALEINNKKTVNTNKTNADVVYSFQNDSTGGFIVDIEYKTINLFIKNGDQQYDLSSSQAGNSINPIEKMLGFLQGATFKAYISPSGTIIKIDGYKELGDKIFSSFHEDGNYNKQKAQAQWDKMVGNGLLKTNLEQLFSIFPDSTLSIGDEWRIETKIPGDFNLNFTPLYKLKSIKNNIAFISSEADIKTSDEPSVIMGQQVNANLKGSQAGNYELNATSGMLLKRTDKTTIKGELELMGKQIPVEIKSVIKLTQKNKL